MSPIGGGDKEHAMNTTKTGTMALGAAMLLALGMFGPAMAAEKRLDYQAELPAAPK